MAHLEALRRFDLDTVMFPVYPALWSRPEYREPAEELLAVCAERDVGVMVIKAAARRPWADRRPLGEAVAGSDGTSARWADSWYEPQASDDELDRGIHFALSTPGVHAFCTPGDIALLPRVLASAERYAPMTDSGRTKAIEAMAAEELIFPMPRSRPGGLSPPAARPTTDAEGVVVTRHRAVATRQCPGPGRGSGHAGDRAARRRCRRGRGCRARRRRGRSARSSQRSWRMRSRRRGPTSVQP